jgi:hypothetical protein
MRVPGRHCQFVDWSIEMQRGGNATICRCALSIDKSTIDNFSIPHFAVAAGVDFAGFVVLRGFFCVAFLASAGEKQH